MIVPMTRVQVVARSADRDRVLELLGSLAAVHVVPVDPARAVPEEDVALEAGRVAQARQLLRGVRPEGERPALDPAAVVAEALEIRRRGGECQARLAALEARAAQLELWGEVRAERVARLEAAGLVVRLVAVPVDQVDGVAGEVVEVVGHAGRREALVLVAGAPDRLTIPDDARAIPPPEAGRSTVLGEAAELAAALERDRRRLARLAWLRPELDALQQRLDQDVRWSVARQGVLEAGSLCALEGWMPEDRTAELEATLRREGWPAAARFEAPTPGERPPTLVRYPRWAQPIRGLLDMLGTVPGYSELDLGGVFMVALPIFAGMIIADAGYGLVFLLVPLLFPGWTTRLLGPQRRRLLLTFGVTATAWGALTGAWFGFMPARMLEAGGAAGLLGELLYPLQRIRGTEAEARAVVTQISLLIGSTHLILAHLWRAIVYTPSQRALAEVGWSIVLAAMGGLIWILLFGAEAWMPTWMPAAVAGGLAAGTTLVVLFMAPDPNPLRRVGLGLAGTVLPLIGTFGDTLSYIRLMAVGLAGTQIGAAFDTMGVAIMATGAWGVVPGLLVLVIGHLLNMALVLIAIVAHGVRLNMLEFSSHAGVQWTGYAFRPLATSNGKET